MDKPPINDEDSASTKPKRRRLTPARVQINLRIDRYFLKQIDEADKQDCTTRSKLIRTAVFWFLMPQHRNGQQTDEDYIFETIQYRRRLATTNKWMKEHGHELDPYDS